MHVRTEVVKPKRRKPNERPRPFSRRSCEHVRGWLITQGGKLHLSIRDLPLCPEDERGFLEESREKLLKNVGDPRLVEEFLLDLVAELAPHRAVGQHPDDE